MYLFDFLFRHVHRISKSIKEVIMSCCSQDNLSQETTARELTPEVPVIVDYKVSMLIAAGAAMAANCEPCINKIVPDLIEAGVSVPDIRKAVEIGQFVKDKPALLMKEAADTLTGTQLIDKSASPAVCPLEAMKPGSRVS